MLDLRCGEENAALVKILQHLRIAADRALLLNLLLRRFAAHAGELACLRLHPSLVIHHLDERRVIFAADSRIVLTKGRRDMDDTCAVRHGDIVVTVDEESLLVLCIHGVLRALVKRLILLVLEVFSLEGLKHNIGLAFRHLAVRHVLFSGRTEHLVRQRLGDVVCEAIRGLYPDVRILRIDAERDIRRERPWRGRPCEEIGVLVLCLEADDGRAVLDRLVSLCHLMARERRPAARAVRHYLESLVQQPLVPDRLERPPLRFDIVVIVCDIGVLHVGPEADLLRELLPHALVFPDGFLALLNERLQTIGHDLFLLILLRDADFLLHLKLHRKAVRIPAGLSRNLLSLHRMIAGNHILDDTGFHMTDMRLAVCRRRAVIKHINRMTFVFLDTLLEDLMIRPELCRILFALHEIQIGIDFLIHSFVLFS